MVEVYVKLIISNSKKFSEVPDKIKTQVEVMLKKYVTDSKITQEQYTQFIGE